MDGAACRTQFGVAAGMNWPNIEPMAKFVKLGRFSFGMGDRFAHQAQAQLWLVMLAASHGVEVTPVWNKSHREHTIVGSRPPSVRAAAQAAVSALGWGKPWHVDADHIRLDTVDGFLDSSDFFTIDVAEFIGRPAPKAALRAFVARHAELIGKVTIPRIGRAFELSRAEVERVAGKYLAAAQEAGRIYRRIAKAKEEGQFIAEVSMDETETAQTPPELLIILAALADEKMALQTIAPKFTGRFNKGVDYAGDLEQFEREFNEDLAVIAYAVEQYGFPANLKLSVHSGSDKFSIYPAIRRSLQDVRGRAACQDGGHDLAGGTDRPGGGRQGGTGDGKGDLRRGAGASRRIVRALRVGD